MTRFAAVKAVFCSLLIAALLVPDNARSEITYTESRQYGAFEIRFGPYRPDVDDNSSYGGATPYEETFKDDNMFYSGLELDWQFAHPPGISFGLGGQMGFMQAYAKSRIYNDDGTSEASTDYTVLNVIPFALLGVIRVDALADFVNVPIVPTFKIGLNWYLWWTREGGNTGRIYYEDENGETQSEKSRGGTLGWQISPGLAFRLDQFDLKSARTFDNELGINHSYIFVEMLWAFVDRFGNSDYMNLSSNTFGNATIMAGVAMEF